MGYQSGNYLALLFNTALAFNQDIGGWDTSSGVDGHARHVLGECLQPRHWRLECRQGHHDGRHAFKVHFRRCRPRTTTLCCKAGASLRLCRRTSPSMRAAVGTPKLQHRIESTDQPARLGHLRRGPATPGFSVSPDPVGFGEQVVGTNSSYATVTVTNTGSAALTFSAGAVSLTGAGSGQFGLGEDTCTSTSAAPPAGTHGEGVLSE